MLHILFKKMTPEFKGGLAAVVGIILMLGALGKLQILQNILNIMMLIVGTYLFIWGVYTGNGITRLKALLHNKE